MAVKVKELVAKFDNDQFAAKPMPDNTHIALRKGTSFSIKHLIKLFESATQDSTQDCYTDDQKPHHQSSNIQDIESNETNGQFEKTSSSEEYEVFPDIICEDIKPNVNRMGPVRVDNEVTESQHNSVEQQKDEDGKMTCKDTDVLAQDAARRTSKQEDLSSVTISVGQFEKTSAPDIVEDVFPDVYNICDDGTSVNRIDKTIPADKTESENEIEPNLNQARSSVAEKSKTPLKQTKRGPATTAGAPQSKNRNQNYLTRYFIKFGRSGAHATCKQNHQQNKTSTKPTQEDVPTRVETKRIPSFLTSCFPGCFVSERKSSPKVKKTGTDKHCITISVPIPSAKEGEKDGNIEITIRAALRE